MDQILQTIGGENFTIGSAVLEFSYLLAAVLFVIGLKLLSHPESARRGNIWAAAGMLLAMVTTLFLHKDIHGNPIPLMNIIVIVLTITLGTIIGAVIARRVKMTAMPQLVSFYNATGGLASALVALMEFSNPENEAMLVTLLGLIIGSIAFSGSMIAYGKLDGKVGDIFSPVMKYINLLLLAVVTVITVLLLLDGYPGWLVYVLLTLSLVYGITFSNSPTRSCRPELIKYSAPPTKFHCGLTLKSSTINDFSLL